MEVLGTLALTHSSRRTNLERCSVEFLTRRFQEPRRLPPFEALRPAETLYSGAVSCYRVVRDGCKPRLRWLGSVQERDKVQHVALAGERGLWAGYEHRLERWALPASIHELPRLTRRELTVAGRFEHPHLAGLHTVEPLADGRLALACSAPDAVLVVDPESGVVEETLRMPESLYGRNYELTPEMDLTAHYVDDEAQICHLNAASPIDGGRRIVVSTLIQGAVGVFDRNGGGYRELTRGHVGCHGARADDRGRVYFTDSARGGVVFLAPDGTVARRVTVASRWLHDAVQIAGGVFALALADQNELWLYDLDREALLCRRRFFTWPVEGLFGLARRWPWWLGNSTQALAYFPASNSASLP